MAHGISVREILELVSADADEPAERVQQMYAWHFERSMTAVRALVGAAGSLVVALAAAIFTKGAEIASWQSLVPAGAVLVFAVIGFLRFRETRSIYREYAESLGLYGRLVAIRPFLRLHRSAGESA